MQTSIWKNAAADAVTCVLLLLALIVMLWFLPQTGREVSAVTDAQITSTKEEIKDIESKIDYYKAQVEKTKGDLSSAIANKAALDQMLSLTATKLEKADKLCKQYEEKIEQTNASIAVNENASSAHYEQFLHWLRLTYENETLSYLQLILSSGDFVSFLEGTEQMSQLIRYETDLMDNLSEELSALRNDKDSLEVYLTAQEKLKKELTAEKNNYAYQADQAASYITKLKASTSTYQNLLSQYQKKNEELNGSLERMLKEWEEQRKNAYVGGKLMWPLDLAYSHISSNFGWRTYEIYGRTVTDCHYGIDIVAPLGQPIYTANSGTVVISEWHDSYGYYVVVDHGGGIMTLYAHMSRLGAVPGQYVKKGTVIGYVGATGDATGNHLHFEVRKNGVAENPITYVTP